MLLDISTWWQGLVVFEKLLWAIALFFSVLFLLQTLFSVFGGDADAPDSIGDADEYAAEDDGAANQYFTIKNLVAFFTLFGWTGLAAYKNGLGEGVAILIACLGGALMVFLMVLLFRNVGKLKYSGTLKIQNALNQVGETYLLIPGKRGGTGKVHVRIQGSLQEHAAITDDADTIPTGRLIRVTGIVNENILLVTAG